MTRVTRLLHYWTQREALTPTNKIDMFVKRCLAGYLAGPVPSGAGVVTGGRGFGQAPPTAIKKKNEKNSLCRRRRDADPAVPESSHGRAVSLVCNTVVTLPVRNDRFLCTGTGQGPRAREAGSGQHHLLCMFVPACFSVATEVSSWATGLVTITAVRGLCWGQWRW